MRPSSANEWRDFWRDGGEIELRGVLRDFWPPLREADEETCAWFATRVATLLGSGAPLRALVADLGRIRVHELALDPEPHVDEAAAERIRSWFEAESV